MNPESTITIFTDGSSRGNPGPGGFAAVVVAGDQVTEIGGRETHTTNNCMELQAAIKGLNEIHDSRFTIQVFSDSSYVINGITKWVFGWKKNNWITATKKPVENRDLWEQLVEVTQGKNIQWKQVGGHVGVAGNERCDEIATAFADGESVELYSGVLENYRIKNVLELGVDVGAVEKKSAGRAHYRAAAYSYVSAVDGAVETHKTWAECEKRVKGKSGARYKKALSAEDEKEITAEFFVRK